MTLLYLGVLVCCVGRELLNHTAALVWVLVCIEPVCIPVGNFRNEKFFVINTQSVLRNLISLYEMMGTCANSAEHCGSGTGLTVGEKEADWETTNNVRYLHQYSIFYPCIPEENDLTLTVHTAGLTLNRHENVKSCNLPI